MNEITRSAAALAEGGLLLGILTACFMLFFTLIAIRLWRLGDSAYEDVARLPVDGDDHRDNRPTARERN
jgi:hypothetical protein